MLLMEKLIGHISQVCMIAWGKKNFLFFYLGNSLLLKIIFIFRQKPGLCLHNSLFDMWIHFDFLSFSLFLSLSVYMFFVAFVFQFTRANIWLIAIILRWRRKTELIKIKLIFFLKKIKKHISSEIGHIKWKRNTYTQRLILTILIILNWHFLFTNAFRRFQPLFGKLNHTHTHTHRLLWIFFPLLCSLLQPRQMNKPVVFF